MATQDARSGDDFLSFLREELPGIDEKVDIKTWVFGAGFLAWRDRGGDRLTGERPAACDHLP